MFDLFRETGLGSKSDFETGLWTRTLKPDLNRAILEIEITDSSHREVFDQIICNYYKQFYTCFRKKIPNHGQQRNKQESDKRGVNEELRMRMTMYVHIP